MFCIFEGSKKYGSIDRCLSRLFFVMQGKGILFRNIKNTGRWHYSALGSRRGSYVLVGSYVLIRLPSRRNVFGFFTSEIVYTIMMGWNIATFILLIVIILSPFSILQREKRFLKIKNSITSTYKSYVFHFILVKIY